MTPPLPAITTRALALLEAARTRAGAPEVLPGRVVIVDVERQTATLVDNGSAVRSWPVSTARNGIGGEENSFKTPPGWHRIDRKIGAGADQGTVFASREPTGEVWRGEIKNRNKEGICFWTDGKTMFEHLKLKLVHATKNC